jgi:ATP-binding cassette subfamily F protein 3
LEAEERQKRSRALKDTRDRLKQVEAALEPAQKRLAELEQLMASEDLYNDAKRFDECMTEYTALSKKVPALESEWLELTEELENAQ